MRPSLRRVRSCVSSTERPSESTLSFTSPTLVRTNFFVAHAVVPPRASAVSGMATNSRRNMVGPPDQCEVGRDCPAMYPLRALTVRSLWRARTTSGCQPGWPLDSNAMRYWCRSSSTSCRAAMLRSAVVLTTKVRPPVHEASSASELVSGDFDEVTVEMAADGLSRADTTPRTYTGTSIELAIPETSLGLNLLALSRPS